MNYFLSYFFLVQPTFNNSHEIGDRNKEKITQHLRIDINLLVEAMKNSGTTTRAIKFDKEVTEYKRMMKAKTPENVFGFSSFLSLIF